MPAAYNVRPYEKLKDYPILCCFWRAHGWQAPPAAALPPTGLVVEGADGQVLAGGFLYKTDSSLAWLEFIVGDPKAERQQRRLALDLILAGLIERAKCEGFGALYANLKHKDLIRRYKRHGFIETDQEMTSLIRRI